MSWPSWADFVEHPALNPQQIPVGNEPMDKAKSG
jgi:hypothetical protein